MNQIKVGAAISYAALGINILTGIFYTPWMIHSIGRDNFGLYTLAMSVISLFVFDFGLSSSITRFIAKYLALGRQDLADKCLGLVYKLYIFIDIVLFAILCGIYFFIPEIYEKLTPDEISKFKIIYVIAAIYSVISFPFIPVNGILTAHEKIIQLKLADVFQKLFIVISMTVCLLLGYGLYALVLINAIAGILCIVYKLVCIRKITPQKIEWRYSNKSELKEIASYSSWVTVIALAQRCIFNLAPSILGIFSGATAIAILGIAITIEGYCFTFSSAINGIFLPKVSRIVVKEDGNVLPLMIKVGRLQLMVIALIVITFIFFGREFILLWVGEGFVDSYLCAVLIIIPALFHLPQMIGGETIYAANRVKKLAIVFIIMAVCNVAGAFILSPQLGALGICISVCIAYFLRTIGMDIIFRRDLKIDIMTFFKQTFVKSIPVVCISSILGFVISHFIKISSWGEFIGSVSLFLIGFCTLAYVLYFNAYEKNLVISPLRRIIHK